MQAQPRKVQYFKTEYVRATQETEWGPVQNRILLGTGTFHGFFSEGDSGELCTYALVEHADGTCDTYPVRNITFLTPTL